jgi:hypothetical protein
MCVQTCFQPLACPLRLNGLQRRWCATSFGRASLRDVLEGALHIIAEHDRQFTPTAARGGSDSHKLVQDDLGFFESAPHLRSTAHTARAAICTTTVLRGVIVRVVRGDGNDACRNASGALQ